MEDKEINEGLSRRTLFNIIGAVPAVAAVAGVAGAEAADTHAAHTHMAAAHAQSKGPYQRQTFDDHQWHTVRTLCDLIIPKDDRSGSASDAGVPEYLDDWVAFRTDQDGNENFRGEMLGGLTWIDRESNRLFEKSFADASADQQKQILDRIAYPKKVSRDDHPYASWFSQFRSLVVGGFFSSKIGVADLPYLGNTAVAEWKGCDPKVWAVIEDRMKNGYKGILDVKPWTSA